VSQGWLWVLVFAVVCYPALRAFARDREGATNQPWRPELVAAVVLAVHALTAWLSPR